MSVPWRELEAASHAELVRLAGAEAAYRKRLETALLAIRDAPRWTLGVKEMQGIAKEALDD